MIYVISDTHGEVDYNKLDNDKIYKACGNKYPEYVIITGDFGFIFNPISDDKEKYWLKWLRTKPWITLFLKGNHSNHSRLDSNEFEEIEMFNSKVKKIDYSIFMLETGNIYTIENKTFFVLGGAASIDKEYRIPFVSWWPSEVPTIIDYTNSIDNLKKVNYTVDYVLTHTCPRNVKLAMETYKINFNDPTEMMLQSIDEQITYKKWYYGHFHTDLELELNGKKYRCTYNKGEVIL